MTTCSALTRPNRHPAAPARNPPGGSDFVVYQAAGQPCATRVQEQRGSRQPRPGRKPPNGRGLAGRRWPEEPRFVDKAQPSDGNNRQSRVWPDRLRRSALPVSRSSASRTARPYPSRRRDRHSRRAPKPAASPCSGPRPEISSRTIETAAGSSGRSCPGAATTTIGCATVPTSRTTRWSMNSGPNGSHALGRPIRRLSPPQRITAAIVIVVGPPVIRNGRRRPCSSLR